MCESIEHCVEALKYEISVKAKWAIIFEISRSEMRGLRNG
jgi:hypothetical protein